MLTNQIDLFNKMQEQLSTIQKSFSEEKEATLNRLYKSGMKLIYRGMGLGDYESQIAASLRKIDRFGINHGNYNYLKYGYIFMTRPQLNLNPYNLRADRILNLLSIEDPYSIQFAIRAMLDTKFCNSDKLGLEKAFQCPYIDWRSPFFTWITNNLTDFSGSPNYQLETQQDDGGYFGECQAIALANHTYKKPFDLSISVNDPYGGPIDAAMFYWTYYMERQYLGQVIAYPDQIDQQILNYTVSIYRFIMDFTGQYIQRAYKYTGCFPISRPGASVADFNIEQPFVEQARHFSIGFKCGSGVVDERDPIIIKEFNDLCERYYPPFKLFPVAKGVYRNQDGELTEEAKKKFQRGQISKFKDTSEIDEAIANIKSVKIIRTLRLPDFNYMGIPYIMCTSRGPRLDFYREKDEDDRSVIIAQINKESDEIKKLNDNYNKLIYQALYDYYDGSYKNRYDEDLLNMSVIESKKDKVKRMNSYTNSKPQYVTYKNTTTTSDNIQYV